jgi:RNA polymerase sigma-70 factor, ECF subfamily
MERLSSSLPGPAAAGPVIRGLRSGLSDEALASAARTGDAGAMAAIYDRHSEHVRRVLVRILGFDTEMGDVLQDTFVQAFSSIGAIRDGHLLKAWLTRVAVHTARHHLRSRGRRRWLLFLAPGSLPEVPVAPLDAEPADTLRRVYSVLGRLDDCDRILFCLRFIDAMELTDMAEACGISLATVKRRLARAQGAFLELARKDPALAGRLDGSNRWNTR